MTVAWLILTVLFVAWLAGLPTFSSSQGDRG